MNIDNFISKQSQIEFKATIAGNSSKLALIPISELNQSYGVGANTYRAMRGQPSSTYKKWAELTTKKINSETLLKNSSDKNTFMAWHSELAATLAKLWKKEQPRELSIAHKYKLVDLYCNFLCSHNFGKKDATLCLASQANCPIDKQILIALSRCYSNAIPVGTSPSMQSVTHERTYEFCQLLISNFAASVGGTPLLFNRAFYERGNG